MRILVLGATGFLGATILQLASKHKDFKVFGTSRFENVSSNMLQVDVTNTRSMRSAMKQINPDVVIWSLMSFEDEIQLVKLGIENLLLEIKSETKLIFISTDALFVEGVGGYKEVDPIGTLPKGAALYEYVKGKYIGENLILTNHPNHVIIRTGPLYSNNNNQVIEKRTTQLIDKIKKNQLVEAWQNVYRTFVNVNDLSSAIIEMSSTKFNGILHVGPLHKESYYTFYQKRLAQLGITDSLLRPISVSQEDVPFLSFDTSLNTQKSQQLLKTRFRPV